MSKAPQVVGLRDRSAAEWEALLGSLVRVSKEPGYRAILERLAAHQLLAQRIALDPTTEEHASRVARGENKAYNRAIMVLGDLTQDVRAAASREDPKPEER